jgi:hypothetical protein
MPLVLLLPMWRSVPLKEILCTTAHEQILLFSTYVNAKKTDRRSFFIVLKTFVFLITPNFCIDVINHKAQHFFQISLLLAIAACSLYICDAG